MRAVQFDRPPCAPAYRCAPVSPVPVRCTPFLCSKAGPLRVITRVSVHALAFVADVNGHGRRMLIGTGNNVYAWLGLRLHGTDQEFRRHRADLIRADAGGLDRVLELQADRCFFAVRRSFRAAAPPRVEPLRQVRPLTVRFGQIGEHPQRRDQVT